MVQRDDEKPGATGETLEALAERVRFEALLSDLSASFVHVAPEAVDGAIERGLRAVAEFLGFERGTVFQFFEEDRKLHRTHLYLSRDLPPPPEILDETILPMWVEVARSNRSFFMSDPDELPPGQELERRYCARLGLKCLLFSALSVGGKSYGLISFVSYSKKRHWPEVYTQRLGLVAETFASALARKKTDERLKGALAEVERLKNRLEAENRTLLDRIDSELSRGEILGESEPIRALLGQVERVASTDSTVLITGETGTGKELVARAIHRHGPRSERPLIQVNCAALPATLIESELFGHEKGAFSGASARQIGRFEAADGGTLFLDEVGEMPSELQAKLLRVLQEGVFERLGSSRSLQADVRVIAATNRDLARAVREGRFRSDLYYRLNVFPIRVPALRERRDDVPLLVWAMVREFSRRLGKRVEKIPARDMEALADYPWPGNVRELRNSVERAMILCAGPVLRIPAPSAAGAASPAKTLKDVEREHIEAVLATARWRVRGAGGAAERLGMKPTTLESAMKRLGVRRP